MPVFADSGPVILALTIGIFAPLSGWVARLRARSAAVWFAIGAFTGPIALLILAAAPPGRCPDCDRPIKGWDRACGWCGATFPPFWAEEPGPEPYQRPSVRPAPAGPVAAAAPSGAPAIGASAATAPAVPAARAPARAPARRRSGTRTHDEPVEAGSATAPRAELVSEVQPDEQPEERTRRRGRTAASTVGRSAERGADTVAHAGTAPTQPVTSAARPTDEPRPVPSEASQARPAAASTDRASGGEAMPDQERVLSTGIYILGNAGLEVGARYGLARVGDRLRVFGPVDLGEVTVRHERPCAELEVTAIADQLVISAAGRGSNLAMVFRGLGGMQPAEVERVLSERPMGGAPSGGGGA